MPIEPAHRRAEIGQDVAEQVGADDDVEPVRMLHEMRGQDVDVELVGADVRVIRLHRREALVPERHGVDDAVRLGRGGDVLLRPLARQLEGVAHDAVGAAAGEDRFLHRGFVLGAAEHAPADLGILALDVLAHDEEVDVVGPAAGERARHAAQQRQGRRFTYCWNSRRIGISRPQSETWSGTPGKPTAPRKIASCLRIWSSPPSGIMRPCLA